MNSNTLNTGQELTRQSNYLLIMKGGGIKGLAYVGAIEVLEEYFDFEWYAGTSAGAISAILLGAGFEVNELKEILMSKNFNDFKDANFFKACLNLFRYGGFYKAHAFTNWLDKLLAKKLDSPVAVLLKDLPNRVTVYASTEGKTALSFDSDNNETKSVRAAFAARCSMSIPIFFTPQKNEGIDVFDGGLQNNYPVEVLRNEAPNVNFIGLYLGPENFEGYRQKSIFKKIISIWQESVDIEALSNYRDETIIIDPRPISTLDFKLDSEQKQFLLQSGRIAAKKFLKKKGIIESDLTKEINDIKKLKEHLEKKSSIKSLRRRVISITLMSILLTYFAFNYYTIGSQEIAGSVYSGDFPLVNAHVKIVNSKNEEVVRSIYPTDSRGKWKIKLEKRILRSGKFFVKHNNCDDVIIPLKDISIKNPIKLDIHCE